MSRDKLTGRMVWEYVEGDIVYSPNGCLVFDDSVLDKNHSRSIALKGIGMVNCLYVNPESGHYWIVDYRLFNPEGDGKTKLDHVREILTVAVANKCIPFNRVLLIAGMLRKNSCCLWSDSTRLTTARSRATGRSTTVAASGSTAVPIPWNGRLRSLLGESRSRSGASLKTTDLVVTNDMAQRSTQDVQEACVLRWKIEQFHREIKQLTGIEKCQCRKARIQRNHIACAARKTCMTVYQIKNNLLSNYLRQELRSPSVRMAFA